MQTKTGSCLCGADGLLLVLPLTSVALLLAGCAPRLSDSEAIALKAELRPLLERMCGDNRQVDSALWPPSLQAIRPESVRIRSEGLYVQTSSFFVQEKGIFAPCDPDRFRPTSSTDPSYAQLDDNLYLYSVAG